MKFNSPKEAFDYAASKERPKLDLDGEKIIATDSHYSQYYASYVLKSRFKLGEKVISKDASESYYYAFNVLRKKFKLGEKAICTSGFYSYKYAKGVLKSRFKLGEKAIARNLYSAFNYATDGDFWENEKELISFLELCQIDILESMSRSSSMKKMPNTRNTVIKVLFKKKILSNE